MASSPAHPRAGSYQGLLVDYGGVLTTNLFDSFRAFCVGEGLEPDVIIKQFAGRTEARELLIELECGRMEERDFEVRLGGLLGVTPDGLIDRLFAGSGPDEPMVAMVAAARAAGVRTGLISNSWGVGRYDRDRLAELFDGWVISGEVGMRKPAPEIYTMGAERIGLDPGDCVFVDDLSFNLTPAAELGMGTVHHIESARTIAELEALLGVPLS